MARAPAPFRLSDVRRAIKAALAAGINVAKVEIEGSKIVIVCGKSQVETSPLDDWREARGSR